jgi:prophage regulatory protein
VIHDYSKFFLGVMMTQSINRLIDLKEVEQIVGFRHSEIFARIADGRMVPGIKVGKRATRYPLYEIEAVRDLLIGGAGDDVIRARVLALIADRAKLAGAG